MPSCSKRVVAGTYYPDNFILKSQNLPAVKDYAVSEVNVHELKKHSIPITMLLSQRNQ